MWCSSQYVVRHGYITEYNSLYLLQRNTLHIMGYYCAEICISDYRTNTMCSHAPLRHSSFAHQAHTLLHAWQHSIWKVLCCLITSLDLLNKNWRDCQSHSVLTILFAQAVNKTNGHIILSPLNQGRLNLRRKVGPWSVTLSSYSCMCAEAEGTSLKAEDPGNKNNLQIVT